jgi:hydrogenase-4 component E
MSPFTFSVAHMLAGGLVLVSFMLLYQNRLLPLINALALHAFLLALSVAWQAYIQGKPDLYVTALIALGFKTVVIPMALRRMVVRMGLHREIEVTVGAGPTMLLGIGLVALSMDLMLRLTAGASALVREDVALALSIVLLGLLMMVTRRNAVSQIVGFMSLENGLILAGTGAHGMPLVVEISVAFSILIAFIVIGIFLFRIRERFDTVDLGALDRFRESGDDRPAVQPHHRAAHHLAGSRGDPRLGPRLSAVGAAQHPRQRHRPAPGDPPAPQLAAGRRVPARRRSQCGVHPPERLGRIYDQHLQRELYRA